jgi:cell division protein FtsN
MARDYRHGHQPKESFQRKSQKTAGYSNSPSQSRKEGFRNDKPPRPSIKPAQPTLRTFNASPSNYDDNSRQPTHKRSAAVVWGASFLVSLLSLSGFFVAQHFADFGVKSGAPVEPTIYQEQAQIDNQASTPPSTVANNTADTVRVPENTNGAGLVVQAVKIEQPVPVNVNAQEVLQAGEPPVALKLTENEPSAESSNSELNADGSVPAVKNHFSFYQDLSQTQVVVDAVPISVKLSDPYYIQGGTFDTVEKARNEQKRLAQHGLNLVIAKFESPRGIYYRLRMGPYTDRLEMNKKRNELRRLGVDTLLIKMPK